MFRRKKSKTDIKTTDPVLSDQGGRSVAAAPKGDAVRSEEAIRQKAYDLYEQRGREEGHAMEDWLTAEAQITRGF
jgi:hypothetical protein